MEVALVEREFVCYKLSSVMCGEGLVRVGKFGFGSRDGDGWFEGDGIGSTRWALIFYS